MSITPKVDWYTELHMPIDRTKPYDFGTVTADERSPVFTFNIWNNKGGITDVPKLEFCTITTRDEDGGTGDTPEYDIPLVAENWMHVQIDSLGETDLGDPETSKIGKDFSKKIGTTGSTTKKNDGTSYENPLTPAVQEILGVNNNGNPADSAGNFATLSFQVAVPLLARSGMQKFKNRMLYQYV